MLDFTNAHLLKQSIGSLLDSPYFSAHTLNYARALHAAAQRLLERWGDIPRPLRENIIHAIWLTHKYIAGSTSNDIPFEMEHCLTRAIKHWKPKDEFLISTALMQDKEFSFVDCDPWKFISPVLPEVPAPERKLIQIALPRLYKHSPLLCVPLFHELGHFIDIKDALTEYSFVLSRSYLTEAGNFGSDNSMKKIRREICHRRELFADLFCASYMGMAAVRFLHEFALDADANQTHPSTNFRKHMMVTFLRGKGSPFIDLFNAVLSARGLPKLGRRFSAIPLRDCYGDYRPATIESEPQLFGIFNSAWSLLASSSKSGNALWPHRSVIDRMRIANDLTEKTIRNHCIREKWHGASAQA